MVVKAAKIICKVWGIVASNRVETCTYYQGDKMPSSCLDCRQYKCDYRTDDDTCKVCGAYLQDNNYCANGHIRLEADIVRKHFRKIDTYKGPLGGSYSTWTNKQIAVGIHDDDDEIVSVFDLTKQSFVYFGQKTKDGANIVKKTMKKNSKKLEAEK